MNPPTAAVEPSKPKSEQDLRFDARNPRLSEDDDVSQEELLKRLWRDFAVDELALSIAANGFFPHEPLFAAEEEGELVVVEGNRRLAAVRLLRHASMRAEVGATDLPRITKKRAGELETLPVVVCPRADVWQYVGFKHVNGPQAWRSHSKAQYIAWVHDELGVSLPDIAKQIGDQHQTVRRLYRALMVLQQAEDAEVYEVEDRAKKQFAFSHLYTGLDYNGFESFLGIKRETSYKARPVPKRNLPQLGQLLIWLYGSKSREAKPLIRSQNPDLRLLDEILQTKDGTAALKRGLGLDISHDIGRGDDALFREALLASRQSLQEARGKLLSGYQGERDLKRVAEDILTLAESIDEEMHDQADRGRRAKKTKRSAKRPTRR
jgi:ParB-like nuclease domain